VKLEHYKTKSSFLLQSTHKVLCKSLGLKKFELSEQRTNVNKAHTHHHHQEEHNCEERIF